MAILRKPLARILVRPPVRPSNGAQTVNEQLGKLSRLSRKSPVPEQYRTVINWGNSSVIVARKGVKIINQPGAVAIATNKHAAFVQMRDKQVSIPDFATKPPNGSNDIWLARTIVTGSGGEGIVVVRPGEAFPAAPLYVKYIQKTLEWRMHVVDGKVIFVQQKKRKSDAEQDKDQKLIRNYDNGWVFCPIELDQATDEFKAEAVKAIKAVGLDFGAVDMIAGKKDGKPYILEINTAPGLESPGLIEAYKNAFLDLAEI